MGVSGALPLLVAAALTPAGTWHVGAPVRTAAKHVTPSAWRQAAVPGHASERSIVARGQDRRGAMPALTPSEGSVAAPQGRRRTTEVATGRLVSAPRVPARARAPPR